MRSIGLVSLISIAVVTAGSAPAWALAGGGLAPGGPMSGSVQPSCNGYNLDGTPNTSPGADRPGCVDHSTNALKRPVETDRARFR